MAFEDDLKLGGEAPTNSRFVDDMDVAAIPPEQPSILDKITSMRNNAGLGKTPIEYLAGAAQNIPESASNFVSNFLYPFTDYVGFQEGMGKMAADPNSRQAVIDMYKNRLLNPGKTFQEDPVGSMADLSMLGRGIGLGSILPGMAGQMAGAVGATARAVDPLAMAGKVAGGAARFAGEKVVAPAVGRLAGYTTESPIVAFKGGDVFRKWMRGDGESTEILANVRGAIDDMADARRIEYNNGMTQLNKSSQGRLVDINPVKAELNNRLRQFQVQVDPQTGKLDFSRVKGITTALEDDITQIHNKINDWGNKPGDYTVNGMDTLKQQLDTHFSSIGMGDRVDAFLKPVKDKLINQIEQTSPGYTELLSKYGKEMELQSVINTAFSTKNPRNVETAIRKVEQALQDNNTYRKKLVETMDSKTGSEIKEMIAGMNLRGVWPKSWLGASTDMATIGMVAGGVISPKFLAVLAISSPRLVGEFSNMIGRIYAMGSKTRGLIPRGSVGTPAFQAGRAVETTVGNTPPQMTQQEF